MVRLLVSALIAAVAAILPLRECAFAQQAETIQQVVIDGNQRIEAETIRSYLSVTEGDNFDAVRIDKSLKALYATGLFADVTIHREGGNLLVHVVENPVINRIAFEGNKHLETDKLQTEIQLRSRGVYNRSKVQSDVQRLLDLYRRNGRFAATVEPKIIKLDSNRIDLVFEINEGSPTYVMRIDFVGNTKFSDGELKDVIESKEERWYRFLSSSDSYDPDRVNYDREQLRKFYLKNGYADFRVVSAVAQLTPDRKSFFLTFTLEEGPRYHVGKVDLTSALPDLKVDELKSRITIHQGDWYDAEEIENTIQGLTDEVGNKGFAFVDIKPQLDRDAKKRIIGITFDIEEGRRVIVERIDIEGNVRTLDKVIRRQVALVEGDAFNAAKMRRSEKRIKDLDFFKKATVTNVESDTAPDRTIVKVNVEEKSTGSLSLGAGWSSLYGPLAQVGAKERNILGTGREVSLDTTVALAETSVNFGYTDPYFLDRHLIAGLDLFLTSTQAPESEFLQYRYDRRRSAHGLLLQRLPAPRFHLHRQHGPDLRHSAGNLAVHRRPARYQFRLRGQPPADLRSPRQQARSDHGLLREIRQRRRRIGGRHQVRSHHHQRRPILFVRQGLHSGLFAGAGYITGYDGKNLPINQRFYLGGASLRGFRDLGVTPVDTTFRSPLGGVWDGTASAEVTFPLGLPKEIDIRSKLFTDIGIIGPTDPSIPDRRCSRR